MAGPIWEKISDDGKDFVKNLLVVDPKHRLNAAGALVHPWLHEVNDLSAEPPSEAEAAKLENSFLSYREASTLKKLSLNVRKVMGEIDMLLHLIVCLPV